MLKDEQRFKNGVAERKNFKSLFSEGIILTVEVSILNFRPMRMI